MVRMLRDFRALHLSFQHREASAMPEVHSPMDKKDKPRPALRNTGK